MKRISSAGAAAFVLATAVAVSAQQAGPPPAAGAGAPAGPRRGGGPPGGGPENGMNIRPPNGTGQTPAVAGQTRAPEQKLGVKFAFGDLHTPCECCRSDPPRRTPRRGTRSVARGESANPG
jgi:hypothetical protein